MSLWIYKDAGQSSFGWFLVDDILTVLDTDDYTTESYTVEEIIEFSKYVEFENLQLIKENGKRYEYTGGFSVNSGWTQIKITPFLEFNVVRMVNNDIVFYLEKLSTRWSNLHIFVSGYRYKLCVANRGYSSRLGMDNKVSDIMPIFGKRGFKLNNVRITGKYMGVVAVIIPYIGEGFIDLVTEDDYVLHEGGISCNSKSQFLKQLALGVNFN